MKKGSKVGIVCCSDGQPRENEKKLSDLDRILKEIGLFPVWGSHIFARNSVFSGTGEERAADLMEFYRNPEIEAVFDISGGEIANEILPWLDFDMIGGSGKLFWGYSDLTTVINAIFAKTGRPSVLYQVRNLTGDCWENQIRDFKKTVFQEMEFRNTAFHASIPPEIQTEHILGGKSGFGFHANTPSEIQTQGIDGLFSFPCEFVQGNNMEGIVAGGNIRCLLKLAGTEYFPDMEGKILFLEAAGGMVPQMTAYLCQLKMMGVFEKIRGILLGTFLRVEAEEERPAMEELVIKYAGDRVPVAKTRKIGHLPDSKAVMIGKSISLGR